MSYAWDYSMRAIIHWRYCESTPSWR